MFSITRRNSRKACTEIVNKSSQTISFIRVRYVSNLHHPKSSNAPLEFRRNAHQQSPPFPGLYPSAIQNSIPQQSQSSSPLKSLPKVTCLVRARIPTTNGSEMFLHLYKNSQDKKEHLAIVFGNEIRSQSLDAVRSGETEQDRLIRGAYTGKLYPGRIESSQQTNPHSCSNHQHHDTAPLVRIHSECYTGETVWSARCDCGEQLDESANLMGSPSASNPHSSGIIIYLRQEGRGIGLGEKLKAYNLQDLGADTVEANLILQHPADGRSYELATAMLLDLGQKEIRLLTNNPEKVRAIEGPNKEITVKERIAMVPLAWKGETGIRSQELEGYMKAKVCLPTYSIEIKTTDANTIQIEKMAHML